MANWLRWFQKDSNAANAYRTPPASFGVSNAVPKPEGSAGANPEALKIMVEEAVVISDRLQAAVSEVDSSMGQLDGIASRSAAQEETLRRQSQSAMVRLEEAFSSLQEVAAASQEIRSVTEMLRSQSNETRDVVVDVCRSLNQMGEFLNALTRNHAESVNGDKDAVAIGLAEAAKTREKMDVIFNSFLKFDQHVVKTLDYAVEQADRTTATNQMLEEVVELVGLTTGSVDDMLAQNRLQRNEINNLGRVSQELKESADELIEAVQQAGGRIWEGSISSDMAAWTDLLRVLAADPALADLDEGAHSAVLGAWLKRTQGMEAIWSNRSDGSFVFSEPEAGLLNARGRDWWRKAMAGETFISDVYLSAITKRPCLTVSMPLRRADGTAFGVIGIDIVVPSQ